jgi:putative colanic acid biosynthesis acetyltransferase WcaF
VYLCTGSHRWDRQSFDLETKPIVVEDKAWLGAMCRVAPGVRVGEGAVLTMGSVAVGEVPEWQIVSGNPAQPTKRRSVAG